MNKQIRREQDNLTNSHWKGMTSSIQPISPHRYSETAYVVYDNTASRHHDNAAQRHYDNAAQRHSQAYSEYNTRRRGSHDTRAEFYKENKRHNDIYGVPQRNFSDSSLPRENGTMYNTLGRSRRKDSEEAPRAATLGRHESAPRYHDDRAPPPHHRAARHYEDDPRHRETAFPPRDVYFDKVRSRDDVFDSHSSTSHSSKGSRRYATLQPGAVQDFRRYSQQEDSKNQRSSARDSKMNGSSKVPEDLYKAVQQRTPNEHIFVEYGKEVKRVVTPPLPIPLDKLLDKIISTFGDTLTADMVPLKALYIQDAQTKIFYQLDDHNDVAKGSHLKLHEDLVIKNIDRGSSQSLEDLNNSSNSSLSSGGGFVIPTVPVSRPAKRPGKSRLSLVEERLSMITHEVLNQHKSDSYSEVSSQTDLPVAMQDTKPSVTQLHNIIRTLYHNLQDTKSELLLLRRRELESRAEMEEVIRTTREEVTRHIEAALPRGIRGSRLEADKVEAEYKLLSEDTYSNIKDLERTVDVLKTDVVKRKVRLDPVQLEHMEKELQSYSLKVNTMNSTFDSLKEQLKRVMKEELEIIVSEEQFLEDEEPALEDVTVKCEELEKIVQTLKKVASMQQEKGTNPLAIYTASEYDIMEERHGLMQAIAGLVPNHDERIQSIQATEEIRQVQKKFQKSESDFVAEEIQFKSQNLRKTNAFEELERQRAEALKAMYTAQPPPHKFGRKTITPIQFTSSLQPGVDRKVSISKCKSMSSIANEDDTRNFKYSGTDSDGEGTSPPDTAQLSSQSASNIKRSQSFTKEKDKHHSSEDEKTKKKTVFGFFSKKSKSNSKHDDSKHKENNHTADPSTGANGDVFVVDTAHLKNSSNPPSPALRERSNTEGSRKNLPKSKGKTDRTLSVGFEDKSSKNKKGKGRS